MVKSHIICWSVQKNMDVCKIELTSSMTLILQSDRGSETQRRAYPFARTSSSSMPADWSTVPETCSQKLPETVATISYILLPNVTSNLGNQCYAPVRSGAAFTTAVEGALECRQQADFKTSSQNSIICHFFIALAHMTKFQARDTRSSIFFTTFKIFPRPTCAMKSFWFTPL